MLWEPLSALTLRGAAVVLGVFTRRLLVDLPAMNIGTDLFLVHIAPACSGVEGLGLILVFLGGWMAWARSSLRFPRALWLLPVGAGVALLVNVLRIVALIGVGDRLDPQLAFGAFHSRAGWVLFCGAALGVIAIARRLPFFRAAPLEPAAETWNPTAAFLGPLLAAVAAAPSSSSR